MTTRGLRILLALLLLLAVSSSVKSSAEINESFEQPGSFGQNNASSSLCAPAADLPYRFYLPVTFASGGVNHPTQSCEVIYQNPPDDTVLPAGSSFDMRWTIKNTSSSTWQSESTCLRFVSGDRMHSGGDIRDLPYDVEDGSAVDLVVSMQAPSQRGTYASNWALVQNSSSVCRFFVIIKTQ